MGPWGGLGFRVWGLGFGVWGCLGFRVTGFRVKLKSLDGEGKRHSHLDLISPQLLNPAIPKAFSTSQLELKLRAWSLHVDEAQFDSLYASLGLREAASTTQIQNLEEAFTNELNQYQNNYDLNQNQRKLSCPNDQHSSSLRFLSAASRRLASSISFCFRAWRFRV